MSKPRFKVELNSNHLFIKDIECNFDADWMYHKPYCDWIKSIKENYPKLKMSYNCVLHGGGAWFSVFNGSIYEYKDILNDILKC